MARGGGEEKKKVEKRKKEKGKEKGWGKLIQRSYTDQNTVEKKMRENKAFWHLRTVLRHGNNLRSSICPHMEL